MIPEGSSAAPPAAEASDLRAAEALIRQLSIVTTNHRIFSDRHPRFRESMEELLALKAEYFRRHPDRRHFAVTVEQDQLCYENVPLFEVSNYAVKMVQFLKDKQLGGVAILPETTSSDIVGLIETLVARPSREDTCETVRRSLESRGIRSIIPLAPGAGTPQEDAFGEGRPALTSTAYNIPELRLPLEIYRSALAVLHDVVVQVQTGAKVDLSQVRGVAERIARIVARDAKALIPMASVKYHDEYTLNHSVNVCLITSSILASFVKDPDLIERASHAALLHDVGKTRVPHEILYKKGRLTEEEMAVVKHHPRDGAELILSWPDPDPLAVATAFGHHLRDDTSGYPELSGPFTSGPITDVVAVADVYEALTSVRPYKSSLPAHKAFQVLSGMRGLDSRRHFIRLLLRELTLLPPGTIVRLDTGETAVVLRANPADPVRPVVRPIANPDGSAIPDEVQLDLAATSDRPRPVVQGIVEQ